MEKLITDYLFSNCTANYRRRDKVSIQYVAIFNIYLSVSLASPDTGHQDNKKDKMTLPNQIIKDCYYLIIYILPRNACWIYN